MSVEIRLRDHFDQYTNSNAWREKAVHLAAILIEGKGLKAKTSNGKDHNNYNYYTNARKGDAKIRITMAPYSNSMIQIFRKTAFGGWSTVTSRALYHCSSATVDIILDYIRQAIKLSSNYTVKKFNKQDLNLQSFRQDEGIYTSNGTIELMNVIHCVRVSSIVAIESDGKCSTNLAYVPGEECWAALSCQSGNGASFDLLSDGKKWLPAIRRRSEFRVADGYKPKTSVDLKLLCQLDKRLIELAIKSYLGGKV